jgi:hypothetical protein
MVLVCKGIQNIHQHFILGLFQQLSVTNPGKKIAK